MIKLFDWLVKANLRNPYPYPYPYPLLFLRRSSIQEDGAHEKSQCTDEQIIFLGKLKQAYPYADQSDWPQTSL